MIPLTEALAATSGWLLSHSITLIALGVPVMIAHRLFPKRRCLSEAACWTLILIWLPIPGLQSVIGLSEDSGSVRLPLRIEELGFSTNTHATSGLVLTWLTGWILAAGWSLHRSRRFFRQVWTQATSADEDTSREVRSAARHLGLRRVPIVRICANISTPCVIGGLRPVLALPTHFASEPADARFHVLLHELMHLKRRDPLFAWALHQILLSGWFHPVLWWVGRRLQAMREVHCDEDVLRVIPCRDSYRSTLLTHAKRLLENPQLGLGFGGRDIVLRLQLLTGDPQKSRSWRRVSGLVGVLLWLVLTPASASADRFPASADRASRIETTGQEESRPNLDPSGCLRLRYRVYAALAAQAAAERAE